MCWCTPSIRTPWCGRPGCRYDAQLRKESSSMKFRKKPVIVDAMQFVTNNEPGDVNMNAIVTWINRGKDPSKHMPAWHNGTDIHVPTLEGIMTANVKDWIIRGVKGEFYPCKPDIFEQTYEVV